jgi:hypothetical protein
MPLNTMDLRFDPFDIAPESGMLSCAWHCFVGCLAARTVEPDADEPPSPRLYPVAAKPHHRHEQSQLHHA